MNFARGQRSGLSGWVAGLGHALLSLVIFALVALAPLAFAHAEAGKPTGWDLSRATESIIIGRVELRYDPALRPAAEELAEKLPGWWSRIENDLAGDLDDSLQISFVTHSGQVARATGMPQWAAGVAHPPSGEIVIAAHAPDGSPTNLVDLLKHELVHVALYRATGGTPLPRWFHEGAAESFSDTISLVRAQNLAATVFGAGVPPLDEIDRRFRGEDGYDASVAYAASRDFVSYLRFLDEDGAKLRTALRHIRTGGGFEAAFIRAYGRSLEELDAEWRAGLRGRFAWFPVLGGGELPFLLIAPLVVIALVRRRRKMRLAWARLEREDLEDRERLVGLWLARGRVVAALPSMIAPSRPN